MLINKLSTLPLLDKGAGAALEKSPPPRGTKLITLPHSFEVKPVRVEASLLKSISYNMKFDIPSWRIKWLES